MHRRNAAGRAAIYALTWTGRGSRFVSDRGRRTVQTAQPRDIAALALVVGVFMVLFIVSVLLGSPTR